jgi:hypothetical protein
VLTPVGEQEGGLGHGTMFLTVRASIKLFGSPFVTEKVQMIPLLGGAVPGQVLASPKPVVVEGVGVGVAWAET